MQSTVPFGSTKAAWPVCCLTWLLSCQASCALETDLATGEAIQLAGGTMHVSWYPGRNRRSPDLLIHFHGAVSATTSNFARSRIDGVLVTINYRGLSSAYTRPFRESPRLFQDVIDRARDELRDQRSAGNEWGRVCVSSFSAGYGAVREILKTPQYFERIDGVLAADSIYAGLQKDARGRRVNELQMRDFRRFARLACEGKKTFVVTHSYIETPYASTRETADDLLKSLGMSRETPERQALEPIVLRNRAVRGNFTVLGYDGDTGEAHMEHLRRIATWWKLLPLGRLP